MAAFGVPKLRLDSRGVCSSLCMFFPVGEKWMFCESECDQMGPGGSAGPHRSPEQWLHLCKVTLGPACTSAP